MLSLNSPSSPYFRAPRIDDPAEKPLAPNDENQPTPTCAGSGRARYLAPVPRPPPTIHREDP